MKTYTFAEENAPVREHMTGLVSGLELWANDCERQRIRAASQKSEAYWRGKRDAFREVIETIKDSNSI